jgi:hypothetical protein
MVTSAHCFFIHSALSAPVLPSPARAPLHEANPVATGTTANSSRAMGLFSTAMETLADSMRGSSFKSCHGPYRVY